MWGCGPVGQFAIASVFMLGAARVIAIDRFPERLDVARSMGAITIDYAEEDVSVLAGAGWGSRSALRLPHIIQQAWRFCISNSTAVRGPESNRGHTARNHPITEGIHLRLAARL